MAEIISGVQNIINTDINQNVLIAFLGGLIPALLWLFFWLKSDNHPEPKILILLTFIFGMAMAPIAYFLERAVYHAEVVFSIENTVEGSILILFAWSLIEECLKYFAAKKAALDKKECDEPVDEVMYMITAAMGFAALENMMFLFSSMEGGGFLGGAINGPLRFLGATLLHSAMSAIVGISLAFCFFHKHNRKLNLLGGLSLATILHFLFNYFIMESEKGGERNSIFMIFFALWIVVLIIIFIVQKIKKIITQKQYVKE